MMKLSVFLLMLFLVEEAFLAQIQQQSGLRRHQKRHQHGLEGQPDSSEFLLTHENSSAFLGCHSQNPDIFWRQNGKIVREYEPRFESEYIPSSSRHVLQINPVKQSDFGLWSCHESEPHTIKNTDHNKTRKRKEKREFWSLVVLPKVETLAVFKNIVGDPEFQDPYSVISVQEGDDLTLFCAILVRRSLLKSGSHKNFLRWKHKLDKGDRDESWLDLSRQSNREYFVQNKDDLVGFLSTLYLSDVKRQDSLTDIQCHCDLPESTDVTINVEYPPTFTITRTPGFGIPILGGMTVSLECDADVKPKSFGKWIKDERILESENGSYVIDSVTHQDTGWYQCFIEYNGNEYSSIGYFLSVKVPETPDDITDSGAASSLESTDADTPGLDLQHHHQSSLSESAFSLPRRNFSYDPYSQSVLDNMIAENVIYSDTPNCSVSNSQYKSPYVHSDNESQVVFVIEGTQVPAIVLSFTICSNPKPSRILWATPVHSLRPGQVSADSSMVAKNITRLKSNVTCYTALLEIHNILDSSYLGEYVLVAKNVHGISDGQFVLSDLATQEKSGLSSSAWKLWCNSSLLVIIILKNIHVLLVTP